MLNFLKLVTVLMWLCDRMSFFLVNIHLNISGLKIMIIIYSQMVWEGHTHTHTHTHSIGRRETVQMRNEFRLTIGEYE